ncbi:MAG: Gfo/Idh/MocA family oxidoreductase, partial [Planctomycetota bacterium]
MSEPNSKAKVNFSRRQFLKGSSLALAGAVAAVESPFVHTAHAADDFEIKIGLIGCGGRGTGAVLDAMGAATKVIYPASGYHTEDVAQGARIEKKHVKVVALADLFDDRLANCRAQLAKLGLEIPQDRCFVGFDAHKQLLAVPEINYVVLATPPHFRPAHLKAAVEAGKNVFLEKPAAVDAPGVKMVMEAGKLAKEKGLGIAAGTQRRHMKSYQETIRRLHEGAIGEIVYARCYWNGGEIWVIDRQDGWSDVEWQLRNWNYFTWLSGDHIVEQHVHNLD